MSPSEPAPTPASEPRPKQPCILIVDDDPQVRRVTRKLVELHGFSAAEAANGHEGLEMFRAMRPDVVLLDIFMPEKDGFEMLSDLRRIAPNTPVIAMSGGGRTDAAISLRSACGEDARVDVRDDGHGIPESMHASVFEKFGQVRDEKARLGSGLGLTFCKMAVEAHGGEIGLQSARDAGATFWFTIPKERSLTRDAAPP